MRLTFKIINNKIKVGYGIYMDILKFFVAILPIFVLGVYIYIHDKEKEPTSLLISSFVVGALICIPCIYVEQALSNSLGFLTSNMFGCFLYVFICIALVEEGYKYLGSYIVMYDNKNNDYTFDCVVYTTFLALGFSFFENMIYFGDVPLRSMILRGFTAVPVHVACGVIMGYYFSLTKKSKEERKLNFFKGLIYPVLIHAFYNYYLIYIANRLRLLLSKEASIIIIYSFLVLLLSILYLGVHYLLNEESRNDMKLKLKRVVKR